MTLKYNVNLLSVKYRPRYLISKRNSSSLICMQKSTASAFQKKSKSCANKTGPVTWQFQKEFTFTVLYCIITYIIPKDIVHRILLQYFGNYGGGEWVYFAGCGGVVTGRILLCGRKVRGCLEDYSVLAQCTLSVCCWLISD